MPANRDPIWSRAPDVQVGGAVLGPTANTAGTGSAITQIFVADATNGGLVSKVVLRPVASPAGSVARIFVCTDTGTFTAGTTNTAANTSLYAEVTLPAVSVSQVLATNAIEIPLNLALPASYKLLITFGTSTGAAGTGYAVTTVAGKY